MSINKQAGKAQQHHTPQTGQEHGPVHQVQDREHHDRDHLGHELHQAGKIDPNEQHGKPHANKGAPEMAGIAIYIDHIPYHTASSSFSAGDLRLLPTPHIGPERNLFRVVSGRGDDIQLKDDDLIAINIRDSHQGRHFFSDTIIPSKDAVARRAYFIYLADGSKKGHDVENWEKAEAQIDTRAK